MRFSLLMPLLAVMMAPGLSGAEDERLVPSYDEDSGFIRDHPGVDIDVRPWVVSWHDSPRIKAHGGFTEQAIFTTGDPIDPPRKGAVLKYLRACSYGILHGGEVTSPSSHADEQVVFYVLRSRGRVTSGGVSTDLEAGSAVFTPSGVEYRFVTDSGVPLEVIIIVEPVPEGFTPRTALAVRNRRDVTPARCCWAYTIYSLFGRADGLAEPMNIAVVEVERLGIGSPHVHVAGCEEIWVKVAGESSPVWLGKTLLRQDIGDAFLAPPNGLVPHSVINPTESPMAWLYIGNRHDTSPGAR